MNDRIKILAEQALRETTETPLDGVYRAEGYLPFVSKTFADRFAELIAKDAINECRQEWYDLNNAPKVLNEDARSIGIRIGHKGGVLKCLARLNKHFGLNDIN